MLLTLAFETNGLAPEASLPVSLGPKRDRARFRKVGGPEAPALALKDRPKSASRELALRLIEAAPDFLREQYADPDFLRDFTAAIKRDAINGDRTSRHIVHDTLLGLGRGDDLKNALLQALGVTADVARLAVRAAQDARPLLDDRQALIERAEALVADAYAGNPALVARSPLAPYFYSNVEVTTRARDGMASGPGDGRGDGQGGPPPGGK